MSMRGNFLQSNCVYTATALLVALGITCGCGQQGSTSQLISSHGIPEDWSTHHVKFSDPGSEADAIRKGTHDQWLRIVNDLRYQMQQLRRSPAWSQRFNHVGHGPRRGQSFNDLLQRDWAYQIAPAGYGTFQGEYPAKYSFDVNAAPTCSDFVVFPVDTNGSATQANIVGFNNLYDGSCPSSAPSGQPFAPTVKFAYYVDAGDIYTSPVLSLDGTKVAFVTTTGSSSIFHVLKLGSTTGNNGTAYNAPVQPCTVNGTASCTTNNAVDTSIPMSGGAADTSSSPFVDYADDIAYVGDNIGVLHKFTGVFKGTPAEVTTGGWPFTGTSGNGLTGPVYDSVSHHIFGGSYNGGLICIDVSSGAPAFCNTSSVSLGSYGNIYDAPIVDSTAQTVFATGYYYNSNVLAYESTLLQADTNLANPVQANLGFYTGTQYDGDFDNAYYSGNYASGYMYACGGGTSTSTGSNLYRIGFDSSGKMNSSNDGNSTSLSTGGSCTPLTEVYNSSQKKDYLFLGVDISDSRTACNGLACIMSFELGSSFPSGPAAAYPLGGNVTSVLVYPPSGIIIDNVSSQTGASQIYFSNTVSGSATQLSQNGLN